MSVRRAPLIGLILLFLPLSAAPPLPDSFTVRFPPGPSGLGYYWIRQEVIELRPAGALTRWEWEGWRYGYRINLTLRTYRVGSKYVLRLEHRMEDDAGFVQSNFFAAAQPAAWDLPHLNVRLPHTQNPALYADVYR